MRLVRVRFLPTSGFQAFSGTMLENKKRSHTFSYASLVEYMYFFMLGVCFHCLPLIKGMAKSRCTVVNGKDVETGVLWRSMPQETEG